MTTLPSLPEPSPSDDALRLSAAAFAKALVDDVAKREGAVTPDAVAEIKDRVVEEIRSQFFAKDVTPSPPAQDVTR